MLTFNLDRKNEPSTGGAVTEPLPDKREPGLAETAESRSAPAAPGEGD